MNIILAQIPANTNKQDIKDFISPVLKGSVLQKSGHINRIKILKLKDGASKVLEYHGIVSINSDAAAKRVIKKLNAKSLKGKCIAVREYQRRSWRNDPRIKVQELDEELVNRRKGDRRRSKLEEVVDISAEFTGIKGFHRNL